MKRQLKQPGMNHVHPPYLEQNKYNNIEVSQDILYVSERGMVLHVRFLFGLRDLFGLFGVHSLIHRKINTTSITRKNVFTIPFILV